MISAANLEVLVRAAILCLKENRECSDDLITACRENVGRIPFRLRRELAELIEKKGRELAEQNAAILKRSADLPPNDSYALYLKRHAAYRKEVEEWSKQQPATMETTRVTLEEPCSVTLPKPRRHSR
jgi:hypothetical protein